MAIGSISIWLYCLFKNAGVSGGFFDTGKATNLVA